MAVGCLLLGVVDRQVATGRVFMMVNIVMSVLAATAFAAAGAHFASIGLAPYPFIAAAVLSAAAACGAFIADKCQDPNMYWPAFAAMFIAIVVARYAFYAVV